MWFKNSKVKSSKRHKSYNNNYQMMLNALLQLVFQLTEPMCRMILLLIKAALLSHFAVLNGHEKER